jgi:hypothetical protein
MIKTSLGIAAAPEKLEVVLAEVVVGRTKVLDGPASEDFGAVFSMAPAWRCLAPGKWASKQEILQKTYPVRSPLQVETLQT